MRLFIGREEPGTREEPGGCKRICYTRQFSSEREEPVGCAEQEVAAERVLRELPTTGRRPWSIARVDCPYSRSSATDI